MTCKINSHITCCISNFIRDNCCLKNGVLYLGDGSAIETVSQDGVNVTMKCDAGGKINIVVETTPTTTPAPTTPPPAPTVEVPTIECTTRDSRGKYRHKVTVNITSCAPRLASHKHCQQHLCQCSRHFHRTRKREERSRILHGKPEEGC